MGQVLTSVMLPWRNVLGQMIPKMFQVRFLSQQRTLLKSRQHLVKRGQAQKNLVKWALTSQRAARRARLALVEQMVVQLHRTPEEEESHVSHDNPLVDPELVIREEDWVNHQMAEENFDPKFVAVAKQWGIAKVREAEGLAKRSFNVIQRQLRLEPNGL